MRQHVLTPSHCFVLIIQSESPRPWQFWVHRLLLPEAARRRHSKTAPQTASPPAQVTAEAASQSSSKALPALRPSSDSSAPRANSFSKVTNLFCRLPLLAFPHRPEATHLGDLLRISVRRRVNINHSLGFSRANGNWSDSARKALLFRAAKHISSQTHSML